MATYAVPSCSRDVEIYEPEPSVVSALTVCFCCLASETPVINAISCAHTAFVQQYFTEWSNQKLAICYTCHRMLEKIEIFRRQVRESLELLSDYQHTKEQNLNRPRLVNHLVTTDVVITSIEAPIEIFDDEVPGPSNEALVDSDNESIEKIEILTNRIKPVPVNLDDKPIYKKTKPYFSHIKNRNKKTETKQNASKYNSRKTLVKKHGSKSLQKKTIQTTKPNTDSVENSTQPNLLENHQYNSKISKKRPKKTPTILRSTIKLSQDVIKLRNDPKKNVRFQNAVQAKKITIEMSNLKGSFPDPLTEKHEGKIKLSFLEEKDVRHHRALERLKEIFVNSPFKCRSCIQGFIDKKRYETHRKRCHPDKIPSYAISCGICGVVVRTKRSVTKHLQYHIMRYVCVVCGNKTMNLGSSESHYRSMHVVSNILKCKDCDQTFKKRKDLFIHRKREHNKKCCFCEKGFQDANDLQLHCRKDHPDESPIECEHCTLRFKYNIQLIRHQLDVHIIHNPKDELRNKENNLQNDKNEQKEHDGIIIDDDDVIDGTVNNESVEMENISPNNVVQMENISDNNVVQMKNINDNNVVQMENISPNNVVQMKNINDNNVVQMKNINDNNVVQMENISDNNVVQMENISDNNVVQMKNINDNNVVQMENISDNNVVQMENISDNNVVQMENIGQNKVIEIMNIGHNNVEMDNINPNNVVAMMNNEPEVYVPENAGNLSENCISIVNDEPNIVVMEKVGELLTYEHNIGELENINNTVIENNDRTIVELVNNEHNNIELVNNDQNIVEMVNNDHNIVELENHDHNIVELEHDNLNTVEITVGLENDDHNIVELENDNLNTVEIENHDQNIVELENNDHNIVKLENNDQEIVELVNKDQNIEKLLNENIENLAENLLNNKDQENMIVKNLNKMDQDM